ncbi:hypothetical protein CB0940_02604 [Cercospora beticola]|uniref:Uncharacterized protein n=1 Tax=Cercospora beticola TaxID=122368 RepID=A0A2G5I4V5_CERBT|nr:hypothetical protein CB0940_02604 [Cercospora beticola]PIA99513.1 hypothetical protein CB0940_02604 [Cercospora beticola]WPA99749.1 hypothetical protein RHO25_004368 [Cercospora beticola]
MSAPNVLKLPRKIRDRIFEMVLRVPHPIYLFQEMEELVEAFAPEKPIQWLAMLYTSKQLGTEASAVLYGRNKFSLLETTPKEKILLKTFLHGIGLVNASSISHMCISFPSLDSQADYSQFREDSAEILALLREKCTRLKALELLMHSKNCGGWTSTTENTIDNIGGALPYIDRQLNTINGRIQISVRVYSGTLHPLVSATMQDLGWLILARE